MIRNLKPSETRLLIESGFEFFSEGSMPGGFKPEAFVFHWNKLAKSGVGTIVGLFSADGKTFHGCLGFVKCPDLYNGDLIAVENFWYVLPQFRGRGILLLKEFENQARLAGCKRIAMIHLLKLQPDKLGKLYMSMGFEPIETNYIKIL